MSEQNGRISSSSTSPTKAHANGGSVDSVLYRNLVDLVPLVESLMMGDQKGRTTGQMKKRRDAGDNELSKHIHGDNKDVGANDFSLFSSRALSVEKDSEELIMLRGQMEELRKKLSEKDDTLRSAEDSLNQMSSLHASIGDLKQQMMEKDSMIRTVTSQLSNARPPLPVLEANGDYDAICFAGSPSNKLADKQAALEKIEWEVTTTNKKVEKLQEDRNSLEFEMSSFIQLFETLSECDSVTCPEDYDASIHQFNRVPYIDDISESEMQEIEEARRSYVEALAVAKEKEDEESLAGAIEARLRLLSLIFRTS
ncbi:hypothetical protein QJS04_geneDACA016521 [Acorus gramineus]|uniref:Protein MICROTUBULE BINDING PROTEIN 2C n=1 Tax=Acorus gramineus TaxID=55184 RepID=A0AAV9BB75_ACOGR|nr:hypothetical protein QJS04_geneDACA016521 [Acorus gramineus]